MPSVTEVAPQLFTSINEDWETPPELVKRLDRIFEFTLDAAADSSNHQSARWLGPGSLLAEDAQVVPWAQFSQRIFLNPPYGRGVDKWLRKAAEAEAGGATVVVLTAARTDTKFFRVIWESARYVIFVYGRLTFYYHGQPAGKAPFPSAIAVFTNAEFDLSDLRSLGYIGRLR